MPIALSVSLVESLLAQALAAADPAHLAADFSDSVAGQRWQEALSTWREVLGQPMAPADRVALAQSPVLWKAAMTCLGAIPVSREAVRPGDWHGTPQVLEAELAQWQAAGLVEGVPASSQEWPALSLLALARAEGLMPGSQDATACLVDGFTHSAPTVCKTVLAMAPDLDVDAVLARPTGNSDDRRLVHLLFSRDRWAASEVLAARLSPATLELRDKSGQTPLFLAGNDPQRAGALLELGADPDTLNDMGLRVDEPFHCSVGEGALAVHELLQARRTPEQADLARAAFRGGSMAWTVFAELERSGMFAQAQASPWAAMGTRRVGLLTYLLERANFGHSGAMGTTQMTLLSRLVRGPRGKAVLMAEGSLEDGVARAMALCMLVRADDWGERAGVILGALGPSVRRCDPDRLLTILAQTDGALLTDLLRVAGPKQTHVRTRLVECDHWAGAGEVLDAMAQRTAARMGSWAGVSWKQKTNLTPTLDMIEATLQALPELSEARQGQWLPVLLMLSAAARPDHPLYRRTVEWQARGVEPAWPDPQSQIAARRWLARAHPQMEAEIVAMRMDRTLTPAVSGRNGLRM